PGGRRLTGKQRDRARRVRADRWKSRGHERGEGHERAAARDGVHDAGDEAGSGEQRERIQMHGLSNASCERKRQDGAGAEAWSPGLSGTGMEFILVGPVAARVGFPIMARTGYGQFCPVAKTAELLAERWMPLVIRELLAGSCHFGDLRRGIPLISPAVLSQRLHELVDAGVLERIRARGRSQSVQYRLTEAGEELRPIIRAFGVWGQRWAQHELRKEEVDPKGLTWAMHRRLDLTQ